MSPNAGPAALSAPGSSRRFPLPSRPFLEPARRSWHWDAAGNRENRRFIILCSIMRQPLCWRARAGHRGGTWRLFGDTGALLSPCHSREAAQLLWSAKPAQFCSGFHFPPACFNLNPVFCCENQKAAPGLPTLADTPCPPSLQALLGFSLSVKSPCSCSLDSFPACVCKLCGYPKKNIGQGEKEE